MLSDKVGSLLNTATGEVVYITDCPSIVVGGNADAPPLRLVADGLCVASGAWRSSGPPSRRRDRTPQAPQQPPTLNRHPSKLLAVPRIPASLFDRVP
jgi:hypothetical protein